LSLFFCLRCCTSPSLLVSVGDSADQLSINFFMTRDCFCSQPPPMQLFMEVLNPCKSTASMSLVSSPDPERFPTFKALTILSLANYTKLESHHLGVATWSLNCVHVYISMVYLQYKSLQAATTYRELHTVTRKGSNFQRCCSHLQKPRNSIASEAMCTLSTLYPT